MNDDAEGESDGMDWEQHEDEADVQVRRDGLERARVRGAPDQPGQQEEVSDEDRVLEWRKAQEVPGGPANAAH